MLNLIEHLNRKPRHSVLGLRVWSGNPTKGKDRKGSAALLYWIKTIVIISGLSFLMFVVVVLGMIAGIELGAR
jgi:hypothetical protein